MAISHEIDILDPIPYPPTEQHALIGDRRTAALMAANGTIDWFCLSRYDGQPVFGGLLDAQHGGHWLLGPLVESTGQRAYLQNTTAVITTWSQGRGQLVLTDVMAWPLYPRANGRSGRRIILRRLRAVRHGFDCVFDVQP